MTVASELEGTSLGIASLIVARRTVRKFMRTPQLVVVGTIQGALFLFIFRYVFGGAIEMRGALRGSLRIRYAPQLRDP